MNAKVFRRFEQICASHSVQGAVLEVGAVPSDNTLLCMKSLEGATERIGINLDGPHTYRGFHIVKGNANSMDFFTDGRFDVVLCNATLEHDRFFWETVSEIKRVTKSGGLVVIGAPGYIRLPIEEVKQVKNTPLRRLVPRSLRWLRVTTITRHVHNHPGDYYRFSAQTFREVIFAGMLRVDIQTMLLPPEIIGQGIKP